MNVTSLPVRSSRCSWAQWALVVLVLSVTSTAPAQPYLLVSNVTDSSIKKYDGVTGAFLGNFVTPGAGGLDYPGFMTTGPDGNLYVSSNHSHNIKRFNGASGVYIDDFVPVGSGGVIDPHCA